MTFEEEMAAARARHLTRVETVAQSEPESELEGFRLLAVGMDLDVEVLAGYSAMQVDVTPTLMRLLGSRQALSGLWFDGFFSAMALMLNRIESGTIGN